MRNVVEVKDFGAQRLRVSALDPEAMTVALEKYGIKPAKGGPEGLALQLAVHFGKPLPPMGCEQCGGFSPEELAVCPFCGAQDEDAPAEVVGAPPKADDMTGEGVTHLGGASPAMMAELRANGFNGAAGHHKPAPPASKALAKVTKATSAKPVLHKASGGEDDREKALDEAVGRIRQLQVTGNATVWQLGREIKSIFDSELWLARGTGPRGGRYKAFDQFVRDELKMTAANAFSLMEVAGEFTEKQVCEVGTTKLALVLQAPEKKRKKLAAKAGKLSKKQLAAAVKDENAKAGKKPKKRSSKVTAIHIGERFVVDLFAKAKGKDGKAARAHSLEELPWGKQVLANGVAQLFHVRVTAKGLQVVVQTRREDD